jgi:NADH:ubiquinone oxidoreductase subunit 6 (subunit J)
MDKLSKMSEVDMPAPVVRVISPRGVVYALLSLLLWVSAGSMITLLTALIMGSRDFMTLSLPLSILIVTLPIFSSMFLRLRAQELADPRLIMEPSRRRFTVITQIVFFVVSVVNVIGFVNFIMRAIDGQSVGSIWKKLLSDFVVFVIVGGIFTYYWNEEHPRMHFSMTRKGKK